MILAIIKNGEEPVGISVPHRLIRRLGDKPARLAFGLSNAAMIRRRLGRRYEADILAHRAHLPQLSGIDREIVDALERHGIFVTSLDALGLSGSARMLRCAQTVMAAWRDEAWREAHAGREFITAPASAMLQNTELFRWGLEERLLDIAECYLGLPPAYDGMAMIYTVADGTELGTRVWHRDREDRRAIKLAVYCNEVTEQGGPFQLIARIDRSQGANDHYEYVFGTEDELKRRLGPDYHRAIVSCPGPEGTVVFSDAARYFHRGAPVHDKDRKALFYSYFARHTRHPFFCCRSGLTRRDIAQLTSDMLPRQKASARWFEDLPTWLKLIPPAPV